MATATSNKAVTPAASNAQVAQPNPANMSERFTKMVIAEFAGNVGEIKITESQRQLIQGYFIGVDRAIKALEADRGRKNENNRDHKYDNNIPCNWNTVNLRNLALDVVHYARLGIDMMQKNFISPILFANSKNGNYDVNLMLGYNGIKYIAERYALHPPKNVTVELVYSTDKFTPYKKGRNNSVESYDFEITNPFNRGKIIGGFGYIEYDDPAKNELVIMSVSEIEKRKPKYASANFWGGKTKEWVDGKKTEVETEGWYEEMCRKTLVREVYSPKHILLDSRKIDENYNYMRQREAQFEAEMNSMQTIIDVTANTTPIEKAAPDALPGSQPSMLPPAIPQGMDWGAMPQPEAAEPKTVSAKTAPAKKTAAISQAGIFDQPADDTPPFPKEGDAFDGMMF